MKAVIEEVKGVYVIRIYNKDGHLCDVVVVGEVEFNRSIDFIMGYDERW